MFGNRPRSAGCASGRPGANSSGSRAGKVAVPQSLNQDPGRPAIFDEWGIRLGNVHEDPHNVGLRDLE